MNTKQLELIAVPRKRVQLLADQPAAPDGGEVGGGAMGGAIEKRPRRFLMESAAAVETEMAHAMKRALAAHGEPALNLAITNIKIEVKSDLTGWLKGAPPCNGWWEVRGAGVVEGSRLWFDAIGQQWRTVGGSWLAVIHLPADFEYRGLKQPYEKGYRYPVPGAKLARRVELLGNN